MRRLTVHEVDRLRRVDAAALLVAEDIKRYGFCHRNHKAWKALATALELQPAQNALVQLKASTAGQ